jgi:hypothetical protein
MAVRCELPGALRELVHSVTASAVYVRAIEEIARCGSLGDGNGAAGDLQVADLLERTARQLRRASASLLHVYSAYTHAACGLANNRPLGVPGSPVVLGHCSPKTPFDRDAEAVAGIVTNRDAHLDQPPDGGATPGAPDRADAGRHRDGRRRTTAPPSC